MTRLRLTRLLQTPPPIHGEHILLLGGTHHGQSMPMPAFPQEFMVADGDRVPYCRDDRIAAGGALAFPYNFSARDKVVALRAWLERLAQGDSAG